MFTDNLISKINHLKKELDAVILAHSYQDEDIQDIADFVGDSLKLSLEASRTTKKVIVFCGVKFMAETAKILNPEKKVLLPDINAGCSLEFSCKPDKFKDFKALYPNHTVLMYINSSAEVKSLSDIIVTSANAEKIVNQIPKEQKIIFAPDRHLGNYLSLQTKRDMVLWPGTCVVHENFSERDLVRLIALYPKSHILAHPECPMNLLNYATHISSTSGLIEYVKNNTSNDFIVLTEPGIIHQMKKVAPNSSFYEVSSLNKFGCEGCSKCPYMRLNTLEKLHSCMENLYPEILVPHDISLKAEKALRRMLENS